MPDRPVEARKVTLLRRRLSRFLANHERWKIPLRDALRQLCLNSWNAVIFGGVLRDLVLFGNAELPRDVDIVVDGARAPDLERVFAHLKYEKNRFGGLRLQPRGWLLDIWGLRDTRALEDWKAESINFDSLVRSTFLNVEAIAAEISTSPGHPRKIYSAGFFEAIDKKVLDISFEPNPFPALCVVRSITAAVRLNWALSQRLGSYILREASKVSAHDLMKIQESHYGKIRIPQAKMQAYLRAIDEQQGEDTAQAIRLPATRSEQLELSLYWAPVY